MTDIKFTVYGRPQQMGSKKVVTNKKTKKPVLIDDNSKNRKQWANAVATAAGEAMNGSELIARPVMMRVEFYFARPKSHYGTGRNSGKLKDSAPTYHAQSPDLDKLIRNVGDAITGVVIRDDKQIISLDAFREWTTSQECAVVIISELSQF